MLAVWTAEALNTALGSVVVGVLILGPLLAVVAVAG
jgi:hypothetical protein